MQEVIVRQTQPSAEEFSQPVRPSYSKGEELFNAISHVVGGALGLIFLLISVFLVYGQTNVNKYVAVFIYCFTIIALYTMSALYHFLPQGAAKRVFRISTTAPSICSLRAVTRRFASFRCGRSPSAKSFFALNGAWLSSASPSTPLI